VELAESYRQREAVSSLGSMLSPSHLADLMEALQPLQTSAGACANYAGHSLTYMSLWAMDGTTLCTSDCLDNHEYFGARGYARGTAAKLSADCSDRPSTLQTT